MGVMMYQRKTNGCGFTNVNKPGLVKERFVCVVYVMDTYSKYVKSSIFFFSSTWIDYEKKLEGQSYDGLSKYA